MTTITTYIKTDQLAPALPEDQAHSLAVELSRLSGGEVYPRSITAKAETLFFLGKQGQEKYLGVLAGGGTPLVGQSQPVTVESTEMNLTLAPLTAENAATVRASLPFLAARPLGLQKSAGCGDRLGLATPGHIRAIRRHTMAPILAQQSMRENARTGRTPRQVMDEAMWGVLQEGWRDGFGADADHLKTTDDIDLCAAAGYTFYTIDPGEFVDNAANNASAGELRQKIEALPWNVLLANATDFMKTAGRTVDLGAFSLTISPEEWIRAAAKYGRAVAHTVVMYRHLAEVMGDRPFELEMSVDETDTVTTLAEHVYIAGELQRLEVQWVSLAPCYVGTFEKGVDYIGDLAEFEESLARHVAVANTFGPYKLSLHSGSDKFSIYPIASRVAGDLVHLKTAGTSYLEALRAIAMLNPALFREIVAFARERYPTDRATYHVSAELAQMPDVGSLPDGELTTLLDDFHSREILHVTYGSVLNHEPFREPFFAALRQNEETYYRVLETHFHNHFAPFQ